MPYDIEQHLPLVQENEYGGVNPPISDSATFTFHDPDRLKASFGHDAPPGCFLYARATTPTAQHLAAALARLEGTEAAHVTASGMGAIVATLLQRVNPGEEIVASHTIYGGTWALLANFFPRLGIKTHFADFQDLHAVESLMSENTAVLYCESLSNPLLRLPDLPSIAALAHRAQAMLVVDNTFTPLLISPARLGADVVIHSLTKFINGASDCVGGVTCGPAEFIDSLSDPSHGAAMLLGAVLDSLRAQGIYKNLATLEIRMRRHSENARFIAERLAEKGLAVTYPGLENHPEHKRFIALANPGFGAGGILALDVGDASRADALMRYLQQAGVGHLAVSLGFHHTLFSPSGSSTSSEIPPEIQERIGLTPGLIRFSIGLDPDIGATWGRFASCLAKIGLD